MLKKKTMKKVLYILDTSIKESIFIVFVKNPIYILILLFFFIIGGCNKDLFDKYPSSIFNFKVVDYYTGQPVTNAKAILYYAYGGEPASYYSTIGQTDVNGEFQYKYDIITSNPYDTVYKYYVLFTNKNCQNPSNSPNFPDNTHVYNSETTANINVRLYQSSTINLTTKRVSQNPLNLGAFFCGFCVKSFDYTDTIQNMNFHEDYYKDNVNETHNECFCVPSNKNEIIKTKVCDMCTSFQGMDWNGTDFSIDTLHTAYHDSLNFYIEY